MSESRFLKIDDIPELKGKTIAELENGKVYLVTVPANLQLEDMSRISQSLHDCLKHAGLNSVVIVMPDNFKIHTLSSPEPAHIAELYRAAESLAEKLDK